MLSSTEPVEILIDKSKCRFSMYDARGCKRCLQVCGSAFLATLPIHKRDFFIPPEKRIDPLIWQLATPWEDYYAGCRTCIGVCRYNAIIIRINGKPI